MIFIFAFLGGVLGSHGIILGSMFVIPAGFVYGRFKSKKGAFAGAMVGAVTMAVASIFFNYYIVYPVYTLFMPMEVIISMYSAILPVDSLWQALVIFNMPFTFLKGMLNLMLAMWVYKPLSPLLKSKR